MSAHRIAVVGGGISGLATALELVDRTAAQARPLEVTVFEAGSAPGGNIRTERRDGFVIESGPNGFVSDTPATLRLVERLGLQSELVPASKDAAVRYLFRNGRLIPLPTGPLTLLRSPILSRRGRLRVLLEPFARSKPDAIDETVHDFAVRRLGSEATEVLVDAMVSGVFAGDIRRLSLASAFPKLAQMEDEHGSLVRALIARGRQRDRPKPILSSFRSGLGALIERFVDELGDSVHTNSPATRIEPITDSASSHRWRLVTGAGEAFEVDSIVFSAPAARTAPLLAPLDAQLADTLEGIDNAGLAVVALGYEARALGSALRGFGFLTPRREGLRSLGCLWESSIFPDRAPAGRVLLRVMIGGAHDRQAVDLDDGRLSDIARRDLATAMNITAEPVLVRVIRHRLGIPQYEPGHGVRLRRIAERLRRLSGLHLTGSSYRGVSMNACVASAESFPNLYRRS